jgi:rod shape determining protein RodA
LGLAMLVSATYTEAVVSALFLRQAVSAVIALLIGAGMVYIHYRTVARFTWVLYALGLGGLLTVAVFGTLVRGTVSRLTFFGVQVQPSEFMKVGLILALAWLLSRAPAVRWRPFFLSAAATAVPVGLVLLEPDLGVAALLATIWVGLLLFQGVSWKVVSALAMIGALIFTGSWFWLLADYQKDRLATFLDPTSDPQGAGYNVLQSIIALGSGGLFGRGLGHGPQSQLKFLPERHTDFILASLGEELGFVGILLVITLYTILLWRIAITAKRTRDPFAQLFCVGVFILLLVSFTVSAGMNMGLLPVTGIPLPLVSFGGSNLVTTGILLGIVQSIRVYGRWMRPAPIEISHF